MLRGGMPRRAHRQRNQRGDSAGAACASRFPDQPGV